MELQNTLWDHEHQQVIAQNNNAQMKELPEILEQANFNFNEYNEVLVKQLIAKVIVVSAEKIQITFKGVFEVYQGIL